MDRQLLIIGYSGHAFVVLESAIAAGFQPFGYFDQGEKLNNPYELTFIGKNELDPVHAPLFQQFAWIVGIGNNKFREKVHHEVQRAFGQPPSNIIHPSVIVASNTRLGQGIFLSANAVLQPLCRIGHGVICNTGCIVEHECIIGDFVHLAPGSVLAGNVSVGANSFIGANSVVKQGIHIGKNCVIGAGSVVIRDVQDGETVVGNPAKLISLKP